MNLGCVQNTTRFNLCPFIFLLCSQVFHHKFLFTIPKMPPPTPSIYQPEKLKRTEKLRPGSITDAL